MKIVYCIHSTFNSGGTERILTHKVNYLAAKSYEITIITTEQKERNPYYPLDNSIRLIDLGINYSEDNGKNVLRKGILYLLKKRQHKKKLTKILDLIKPDITISMFGNEAPFLPDIQDGSKKIAEIHFSKFFRYQNNRKGVWKIVDHYRSKQDEKSVHKYDQFVCLTNEDRCYWGDLKNIITIPNFINEIPIQHADLQTKQVISVGRLSYQKGYDRLIDAWKIIALKSPEWKLKIFGSGELYPTLLKQIKDYNLSDCISINPPTSDILKEYLNSSICVMTSHYEGLPMVLLEAMSCGLPIVTFDCKCGPKDLITDGKDGYIVEDGNINEFANKMLCLMEDESVRINMGINAISKAKRYSKEAIMNKWENLFNSILSV